MVIRSCVSYMLGVVVRLERSGTGLILKKGSKGKFKLMVDKKCYDQILIQQTVPSSSHQDPKTSDIPFNQSPGKND